MQSDLSKGPGLNPVALAAGLLLAAGLYLPLFFASPGATYVLGLDRIVADGATLTNGLGGGVQMLLAALRFDSPTGLRAAGLLFHLLTVAALAAVLMRRGVHPAGAGLASSLYAVHIAGLAAVLPLDNLGVAMAMFAAVAWQLPGAPGASTAGLLVPALLHPVGLCAWPLRWLLAGADGRAQLVRPLALSAVGLSAVGWAIAGQQDLANALAFAGHSWLQLVAGWRFNELLPWASEVTLARFSVGDINASLSGLFLGVSGAIALLARFGNALRSGARTVLPVLLVSPLLPGLVGNAGVNAPNPLFVLPMVIGVAVLIGSAVSRVITNLLADDKLTAAVITTLIIGALLLVPTFVSARNQTSLFADGRTFWTIHLRREPDSAQAQLALARATLFWATDPSEMANRQVTVKTSQAGAAKLLDLFEPEAPHDVPLTAAQEAEAHWLLAAALTRGNIYAPAPLIEHLRRAVELAPERSEYAEFLADAVREAQEYEQQVVECALADTSTREQRRVALMEQAAGLTEVGLALHPPRIWPAVTTKYEDAMRCDPQHPDAYTKLADGYMAMGSFAAVLRLLDSLPAGLATHSSLLRQRAFATGHLPPPDNLAKEKLAGFRSDQRLAAARIWADVLRFHPDRSEPWFHLAETAFRYQDDPLRAKAFLERGLAAAPERAGALSIRTLRDAIDRKIPAGSVIPAPILPGEPSPDAGPAADGGTP